MQNLMTGEFFWLTCCEVFKHMSSARTEKSQLHTTGIEPPTWSPYMGGLSHPKDLWALALPRALISPI
jgi:hypothetical protein